MTDQLLTKVHILFSLKKLEHNSVNSPHKLHTTQTTQNFTEYNAPQHKIRYRRLHAFLDP